MAIDAILVVQGHLGVDAVHGTILGIRRDGLMFPIGSIDGRTWEVGDWPRWTLGEDALAGTPLVVDGDTGMVVPDTPEARLRRVQERYAWPQRVVLGFDGSEILTPPEKENPMAKTIITNYGLSAAADLLIHAIDESEGVVRDSTARAERAMSDASDSMARVVEHQRRLSDYRQALAMLREVDAHNTEAR